jgi:hypothetical protein
MMRFGSCSQKHGVGALTALAFVVFEYSEYLQVMSFS